ncbi:hypothetical protein [Aliivibrio kagoshimensis]|uniref:hypothetical protein n=1 Tax=Aliivibrio kagoshimensis TaxID=2910230 RepID=UPI003D0F6503
MSELTEKQRYQREYYQKNKTKLCAQKRNQYQGKTQSGTKTKAKRKTRKTSPKITAPARATSPVVKVRKIAVKTRSRIEDIHLARELGVSVQELKALV